ISCFKLENALIYPGGQVVCNNHLVVYEPSANPLERKFIAGLYNKVFGMPKLNRVYCSFSYDQVVAVDSAVLVSSRCSNNYFHWMIEYLPKLKTLADWGFKEIPILIPNNIYPQQLEAIQILTKELGMKLEVFDSNSKLQVKN